MTNLEGVAGASNGLAFFFALAGVAVGVATGVGPSVSIFGKVDILCRRSDSGCDGGNDTDALEA